MQLQTSDDLDAPSADAGLDEFEARQEGYARFERRRRRMERIAEGLAVVLLLCLATAVFASPGTANAAGPGWFGADRVTLMGPAASWHASKAAAPVRSPAPVATRTETVCTALGGVESIGLLAAPVTCEPVTTTTVGEPDRAWHQANPAAGLKFTYVADRHTDSVLIDYAQDSYGRPSLLGLVGRQWPLIRSELVHVDGGASAGLWWRTVQTSDGMRDVTALSGLQRRLVPVVLPTLTVRNPQTGVSIDIGFVPRLVLGGWTASITSTVVVQVGIDL